MLQKLPPLVSEELEVPLDSVNIGRSAVFTAATATWGA